MSDTFRPITHSDSANMLTWRNTDHVRRHVFEQEVIPDDGHARWFRTMMQDPSCAYFMFERDRVPCGIVGMTGLLTDMGQADWGFYTATHAPKGSGFAMLRLAIEHAFGPMGLHQVNAQVLAHNTASLRLHDKLGFARTGLRHGHELTDGTFHDVVLFAKTNLIDR